ncbi:uncharacterized protein [Panulirus ornatus]|uniref:uncharacterized protein n=1 Tax=Panulirus ornatus TaxID=150431 RepID=UPI003A877CB5
MLRVTVLVCVVGTCLSLLPGPPDMVKKYAYMKIMSGCLGEESVLGWQQQMRAACDKCQGAVALDLSHDFHDMLDELRRTADRSPIYIPVPVYQPQPVTQQSQLSQYNQLSQKLSPFTQLPQLSQFNQQPQLPQYGSLQGSGGLRSKRFADLSPERIEDLKDRITVKISNVTCVLRELKMLDTNNLPNFEHIAKDIFSLPVGDALKADMAEAIEMCRDFSLCLPVTKAKHPLEKELGTSMAFLRCMAMKKVAACMKADLRKFSSQMGWVVELEDSLLAASGFLTSYDSQETLMEEVGALVYGGADIIL